MAMPAAIQLQRSSINEPWGFRISGGRDFRVQLQVKKVDPNSPASRSINNGDAIVSIGGTSAQDLTHMQAHQLIKSAGTNLQMTVLKEHFADIKGLKPKGPVKFSPWKAQKNQ